MPSKKKPSKKTAKSKKSPPKKEVKKDTYFKKPKFLKKWHAAFLKSALLRGGVLALTLLIFGGGLAILAFEMWKAPSLSKLLPAEETIAFAEGDLAVWDQVEQYLLEGALEYDGVAWVSDQPLHFTMEGNQMIPDQDLDLLDQVKSGAIGSLKRDPDYIKMRPNLPYDNDLFIYAKPILFWKSVQFPYDWLEGHESIFEWMLATGIAVNEDENGLWVQSYTVADKALMEGEAWFHLDKKYKGKIVDKFPSYMTEFYGGQDLTTTLSQLANLIDTLNGTGSPLQMSLNDRFESIFGTTVTPEETLFSLLEGEYAWGKHIIESDCAEDEEGLGQECPMEIQTIAALSLNEEAHEIVENLQETLLSRGLVYIDEEASTLTQDTLELLTYEYQNVTYYAFQKEDKTIWWYFFIEDDTLFITSDEAVTQGVIDTLSGVEDGLSVPSEILGGDHLHIIHGSDQTIYESINLFDDGISTLHYIDYE